MKPWEGAGKTMSFLKNINKESFEDALKQGLTQDLMIEARAEADNAVIFTSTIISAAARFDSIAAIKFLAENGFDLSNNDRNAILYAAQSYFGKSLVYLLSKGIPIQDDDLLTNIFESEDPFLRASLLLTYAHLPNFIGKCAKSNNNEIIELVSYLDNSLPFAQSVFLSYLKVKTPKWDKEFSEITKEYNNTMSHLNNLVSFDLKLDDNFGNIVPDIIKLIAYFIDNYRKCRFMINEIRGNFCDYLPFLEKSEAKIQKSITFLKNGDPQFFEDIYTQYEYDKELFYHYAISETLSNNKKRAIEFLENQINHIHELQNSIPNYDTFFEKHRNMLKEAGAVLETSFFDKFNTFYCFVHARTAVLYIRTALMDFVNTMIGDESAENLGDGKSIEDSLLQSFQTLKMFCSQMGLKRPEISEEKSQYQITKEEKDAITMRQQLLETKEMEENLAEINEGIKEMNKFSSVCIECHKYCASYVCPHCHLFLHCLLCKKTNIICPGCHKYFEEPLRILKTSYFGEEFGIELIERQRREMLLKEQQQKK